MYILLFLTIVLALSLGGIWLLFWMLREVPEDSASSDERATNPSAFYDPRTWAAFHRFMGGTPLLLTYRRDKRGRFRKVN